MIFCSTEIFVLLIIAYNKPCSVLPIKFNKNARTHRLYQDVRNSKSTYEIKT